MATYSNSYILIMPEPFVDAASKVDLLAIYNPSIPVGTSLTSIGELSLTFDRKVEVRNRPQDIKLLDKDGKEVRSALSFGISNSNPHRVVMTFRTTTLTPGEKYTVVIPEGMVWLAEDPSVKSKEIRLSYNGRENVPVKALRFSPADGSAVAHFNSYPDYLTVTFDTRVKISGKGSCTLYNTDDNSIVASFAASAEGNQAIFYPTGEHNLYRGSNYKVVISEGVVTDLSGNGGNEEITLNFVGAYERQLSSDDVFLFHSNCDDYSNFIFWQSEFNNPASVPSEWGFTAQNPWLLIRDNENSTDQALCAHSMFTPPGESDDWLIVPQIYLPDANVVLSFDAQSYHSRKDDVLKVYVYEDNTVYNYFTMELEDKFKADGHLVFDEIIPAGATDEGLEGEWTHYTVDLSAYAGKNIYIAFVNNNYDKSAIFLDDIAVARQLNFLLTNRTPEAVVDAD
ncbi:MAG: choice-of-anchor J domain-containing protein, partial [Muribaculaceae bacterium]|nr:choice-of-anchor J domain-containing protein [Muribaculaceae bacterium]